MKKALPFWQLVTALSLGWQPAFAAESITHRNPSNDGDSSIERPPLVLAEGEQRILDIRGLRRFSLGGPAVRVQPLPKGFGAAARNDSKLLVKGIHAGLADLWVWKEDGNSEHRMIRVERVGTPVTSPVLERGLGELRQTEVIFSGAGAILRGRIDDLREASRIEALTRAHPREIHDETELTDELLDEGRRRLDAWLRRNGESGRLRVSRRQAALWVEGSVERPEELERIGAGLRAQFAPVRLLIESLPDGNPTVHFKVYLLELKRSRSGSFGLTWPAFQENALRVTTGAIQDLVELNVALNALEGEGSVRVLSNPELVVRAPGEAELFSGGELPIQNSSRFFAQTSWKNYGLSLKLKVTHSTAERVRLEIATEVSSLDPAVSSEQLPGLQSNRMRTQVDAKYGAPLLLSGLLKETTREGTRGLPWVRRIPVLGSLFGSEDHHEEKSELVAILVPSSSPPPPPMESVRRLLPRGLLPPPRDWVSPAEERQLKESPEYPWNALR